MTGRGVDTNQRRARHGWRGRNRIWLISRLPLAGRSADQRHSEKPEAPMPLEFDESPATYDFARNAVMFTAMNGRRVVRFRVTNDALASMAKSQTRSEIEMLAAYNSHAGRIHQIAARKFGQRLIDTDGTVLVIERDVE
jgi:hypothetical protein